MLNPKEFIEDATRKIKEEIGDEKTIIALSGGVDSSVCSVLTQEAIGDNLTAIFVNHGLLREGEAEQVCAVFEERLNFKYVDASDPATPFSGVLTPTKRTFPTPSTVIVSPSATCVHNPLASDL